MTDAAAVLRANGCTALDPNDVIRSAQASGLTVAQQAGKLEGEARFRNIFGNDPVKYPTSGLYTADTVECTREAVAAYLAWRRAGSGRQNGVGPSQLTYFAFQDDAERRGGLHVPLINMTVGGEEMARCIRAGKGDLVEGGARYNGGDQWRTHSAAMVAKARKYGEAYRDRVAKWDRLLSGAVVLPTSQTRPANPGAPANGTRTLEVTRPLMSGPDVLAVQRVLRAWYRLPESFCDGLYGNDTADQVERVQRNTPGMVVDRRVGPATRKVLGLA